MNFCRITWLFTWRVLSILTPIVIDCQIHNTASFDVRFLTDNPFSLPMMTSSLGSIMATMLLAKSSFLEFLFLQTFFLILCNHLLIFQLANFYDFQTNADWLAVWTNQNDTARDRIGTIDFHYETQPKPFIFGFQAYFIVFYFLKSLFWILIPVTRKNVGKCFKDSRFYFSGVKNVGKLSLA